MINDADIKKTLQMFTHFFSYAEKHYGKESFQMLVILSLYKEFVDEYKKYNEKMGKSATDEFIEELLSE